MTIPAPRGTLALLSLLLIGSAAPTVPAQGQSAPGFLAVRTQTGGAPGTSFEKLASFTLVDPHTAPPSKLGAPGRALAPAGPFGVDFTTAGAAGAVTGALAAAFASRATIPAVKLVAGSQMTTATGYTFTTCNVTTWAKGAGGMTGSLRCAGVTRAAAPDTTKRGWDASTNKAG